MSRGLGPLGLPIVPAGVPVGAPAPDGVPAGGFDAAFAELTQALLATAAGAGQPAPAAAAHEAPPAGADSAAVADDGEDAAGGLSAMTVPVPVQPPTVSAVPMPAVAFGDAEVDAADAAPVPHAAVPAGVPAAALAFSTSSPAAMAMPATTSAPAPETFDGQATAARADATTSTDDLPVGLPIDPVVPEGLRRAVTTGSTVSGDTAKRRASDAGEPAASSISGGRAASALPPTSEERGAKGSDAVNARETPVDAPPAAGPVTTATVTVTVTVPDAPLPAAPGLARRAEALQRALGRRVEAAQGETQPDGLAAQVAGLTEAPSGVTADADGGAKDPGEFQPQMRRPLRQVAAARAVPFAPTAPAAGADGRVAEDAPAVHRTDATAAPIWRAAELAARFTAPAPTPPELGRPAAAIAPAVVPTSEAPLVRDVRAAVIEAPVRLAEPAVADDVQAQIVKSMRLQWSGGVGEARVTLKPEYLGDVVATVKVEQGVVTATLRADTPEVRRLLEAQTASLREALVEHGLKLDRVVVSEPETPTGQPGDRRPRGRQPQPPPSRQRRRSRDDERGATFELSE